MEDVTTEEGDRLTGRANEDPLEMKVPISVFLYYLGLQPKQVPLPSHYIIAAVTSSQTRWLICELDLKVKADKHRLNDKKLQLGKEKKTDIPAKLFENLHFCMLELHILGYLKPSLDQYIAYLRSVLLLCL